MTPAKMFEQFGDDERLNPHLAKGDKVLTPGGLGEIDHEFTRGLKWWTKTSIGTYLSRSINELNKKPD